MMGTVKTERHDEHEINEMAKKIAAANRVKLSSNSLPPSLQSHSSNGPQAQSHLNHLSLLSSSSSKSLLSSQSSEDKRIDEESKKGRFGWCEFEKNYIPFIFRHNEEKFTSVRMVERKFLNKFLSVLPPEVNSCHCIRSYYITDSESKLLNEINLKHTDCFFGKEAFTTKDLVVRLGDAKEFYRFLDLCYKKLVLKKSNASDRCGFFRINGESVVPYTVTGVVKYVPLFYFEGETDHLKLKSDEVSGWDLAYLKFCCKVQGIRNELFASEVCRVVALDEIKGHFPSGTTFEDYWPAKGSIEPVNAQRVAAGNWTQKPPSAPSVIAAQQHQHQQQQQQIQPKNILCPSSQQQQPPPPPVYNSLSAVQVAQSAANTAALQRSAYENQLAVSHQFQQLMRAAAASSVTLQQQQQQQRNHMNQLIRSSAAAAAAASVGGPSSMAAAAAAAAAAASYPPVSRNETSSRLFPGKLTQIKEFPMERSTQPPYKLQKALIDQKIVPCINVRPYVFHDLMMTLPDFVRHFYPDLSIEKARHMLQDILKVVLYKGNSGHQEILRHEGKCILYDPVPLVLVKDIMNYMPQMKYMFTNLVSSEPPGSKRCKL